MVLAADLKKLRQSGRAVLATGIGQFVICLALGLAFFSWLGPHLGPGKFNALYLALACSLSSTMIVVKLLYDKFELDSVPGRITLSILVFQDLCAILFLAVHPDLAKHATM